MGRAFGEVKGLLAAHICLMQASIHVRYSVSLQSGMDGLQAAYVLRCSILIFGHEDGRNKRSWAKWNPVRSLQYLQEYLPLGVLHM